jgi:DNA-binding NarL/FixJ family response regulator
MFGHPTKTIQPLNLIAQTSKSPTFVSFAAHASALEAGDAGALEGVAKSFASRGELVFAARAYRQAARLQQKAGERTLEARATTTARLLVPEWPDLGSCGLGPQRRFLTSRETEIASLATGGMTSVEVAARLYLSVRTVNNHLASAYIKLGVHSREELTTVLGGA